MESLGVNPQFWRGKRVLITGNTGFKGSWLCVWLSQLGAQITGYSLPPPSDPNLYDLAHLGNNIKTTNGDVRDLPLVEKTFQEAHPDIVFHLAAQSLVRRSYADPVATYGTNVMGTVHVLEAARKCGQTKVVINVTSDKCYANNDAGVAFRESDPLGGMDPYSSSKACAELVTSAFFHSFYSSASPSTPALASVRAGNVIGGGDWAEDRLVPDLVRAMISKRPIVVRRPEAVRPWQHVLEPLYGYLLLAERMWADPATYSGPWNFGPTDSDCKSVAWIISRFANAWGQLPERNIETAPLLHEAGCLQLDCSKARTILQWVPRLTLEKALDWTVEWYRQYSGGENMRTMTELQLQHYCHEHTT